MKLEGIKFKGRFWFYIVIVLVHGAWFYTSGEIPTRVEAVILLTLYILIFSESITLRYVNQQQAEGVGK